MEMIYAVRQPDSTKIEYFETKKSAADYIIEELCLSIVFKSVQEVEETMTSLLEESRTPSSTEYQYTIEEIKINHYFD